MSLSKHPDFSPEKYKNAQPFPHIIIDDYFDPLLLEDVVAEVPSVDDPRWRQFKTKHEGKQEGSPSLWGPETQDLYDIITSDEFIDDLQLLTGFDDLLADSLGGGYHQIPVGGKLDMHVDFNVHPQYKDAHRRLNVLLYLNKDWDLAYGGSLLLGKDRQVRIQPEFNRLVVFTTSEESWHGHPEPVTNLAPHPRRSFATYFYTQETKLPETHDTVWLDDQVHVIDQAVS